MRKLALVSINYTYLDDFSSFYGNLKLDVL